MYNFPQLCFGKWLLGFSDHFARGSTFVLLQTATNTTNKTRYIWCAVAPKRKCWAVASPAYSTFITQLTKTNKSEVKNLDCNWVGESYCLKKKMVRFIAADRWKWLMAIRKRKRGVSGCSVCLSTHVVRATLLMSDNVTLQNTSLWFSMIVLLNPFISVKQPWWAAQLCLVWCLITVFKKTQ